MKPPRMYCGAETARPNHHRINFHNSQIRQPATPNRITMNLMKPFSLALCLPVVLSIGTKAFSLEEESFADAPVTISVTCTGDSTIDWSKLSMAELSHAGNVLTSSYNSVHDSMDNDDSQLNDLSFNGAARCRMLEDVGNVEWKKHRMSKGMYNSGITL